MTSLIINADDFGITPGVTEGIITCASKGVRLSASAMTCIEGAETVVRGGARRFGGGIGLHLQLTQGSPTLPADHVPTLLGDDGRFPARRARPGLDPSEVAREWRAQINRLRSWGVDPDHLDSHHDVHARAGCNEPVLPIYAALASEEGLPVRGGTREVGRFLQARGVSCPDVTVFLSEIDKSIDAVLDALQSAKAEGPADLVVELCCHPGFSDSALATRTLPKYFATRELELKLLIDPQLHARLRRDGWQALEFRELERLRPGKRTSRSNRSAALATAPTRGNAI